jgi:hypothetical protein
MVFDEHMLVIGTVRIVADGAFADGRRAVKEIETARYLMAVLADLGNALLVQQELIVAVVRLVAFEAFALLNRVVNELFIGLVQMAGFAKVSALASKLIGVLIDSYGFVARLAVAKADRPVNVLLLAFAMVRMALGGNTGLLLGRRLLGCARFAGRQHNR